MRRVFAIGRVSAFLPALIKAQSPQIVYTELPVPPDTFTVVSYRPVSLTLDLLNQTGPSFTWDYASLKDSTYDSVIIHDVPQSYAWQFQNPLLYPDNYSTYALRADQSRFWQALDSLGFPITVENTWEFFRVEPAEYVRTGTGATINGFPLPFPFSPVDTILRLPASFGDSIHSLSEFGQNIPGLGFYGGTVERITLVDGYGTLITPFDTFYNVVRVFTRIIQTDTIYLDSLGVGLRLPPRIEYTFMWITDRYRYPALLLTGVPTLTGNIRILSVQYIDTVIVSVTGVDLSSRAVFAGPGNCLMKVRMRCPCVARVYSFDGAFLKEVPVEKSLQWISLPPGVVSIYTHDNENEPLCTIILPDGL